LARGVSLLPDAYKAQKDAQKDEIGKGKYNSLVRKKSRLDGDLEPLRRMTARINEVGTENHKINRSLIGSRDGRRDTYTIPAKDYQYAGSILGGLVHTNLWITVKT
jgi:hypothetical protein